MTLTLLINGTPYEVDDTPDTPLVYVLRDTLGLTGTKLGCGLEQCGACAVLVDGEVTLSCVAEAGTFEGRAITTIEGIAHLPTGKRVQDAFIETSAAQCGYCTAGLVVAATAFLSRTPAPDPATARTALAPHLCRCGSHPRVLRAVALAAGAS
jgi:aerobic-type carbon monoxide dehydrogenase small subunit (CoxS/CutS family)